MPRGQYSPCLALDARQWPFIRPTTTESCSQALGLPVPKAFFFGGDISSSTHQSQHILRTAASLEGPIECLDAVIDPAFVLSFAGNRARHCHHAVHAGAAVLPGRVPLELPDARVRHVCLQHVHGHHHVLHHLRPHVSRSSTALALLNIMTAFQRHCLFSCGWGHDFE